MDGATIKGVIDRLTARGFVESRTDTSDKRRLLIDLSEKGRAIWAELEAKGHEVSDETLAPLTAAERAMMLELLKKLA